MELKDLEAAMHRFVASQGWYDDDSPKQQSSKNLAISLVLEASEVLEHFQWSEESRDPDALAEEIADVMLYLMQLASINQIDIADAVMHKLDKNYQRKWDTD